MRALLVCLLAVGLTGCSDAEVRRYAALLADQLKTYRAQLDRNLAAERKMYSELAGVFATEAERDVCENLRLERYRISFADARRLETSAAPFDEQEFMRRQMVAEFDTTRAFYLREMKLPEQTTAGLRNLEFNAQKLGALAAALDPFTKETKLGTIASDLGDFKSAVEAEQAKQRCKDLKVRVALTTESLAIAEEENAANKTALQEKLKAEKEALCPTK